MVNRMLLRSDRRDRQGGQIMILFALSLIVIIAMGGLLFSGAQALVVRRQIQNAGDAGALAAANLLVNLNGCSAAGGGGAPRAAVVTAAKNAISANLPGFDTSKVTVTCPANLPNGDVSDDIAVQVDVRGSSPGFFGSLGIAPATSSTATNGQHTNGAYSVALLDPCTPSWCGNRTGCPSYLINGGVTVTYEGSIFVDSQCKLATSNNGSTKAANSAFSMSMLNGAKFLTAGEVSAGTVSKMIPTPLEDVPTLLPDPLGGLIKPCHATDGTSCLGTTATLPALDEKTTGSGQCKAPNNDPCVISPGTYSGGLIAAGGSGPSTLLLRPGVYYIEGGGLQLKSGAGRMLAIPGATATCGGVACSDIVARARYATALTDTIVATNWQADCPPPTAASTCGVMIYNAKADNKTDWVTTGQSDQISNGAQGTLLLRSYNAANDPTNGTIFASYNNVVMWQARTPPVPPAITPQPIVSMQGGACVVLSGTVYAAAAEIDFGGSTCGVGGGGDAVATLQFVCWDLTLAGNNNFYFAYQRNAFAKPFSYGLVK
jgi:Flp pilus assembly protein TadG